MMWAFLHRWIGAARSRFEPPPIAATLPVAAGTAGTDGILMALAASVGVPAAAIDRLNAAGKSHRPTNPPRYWALVDFGRPSSQRRLYLFDSGARTVEHFLVTHGEGSEAPSIPGVAAVFSNVPGSNCSSLGIYRCAEPYRGRHGLSLKLDGLEPSNSNVRKRAIVLHGASYVSDTTIARTGRIGPSDGCFAVEYRYSPRLVRALAGGSLLLAWKSGQT